MELYKERRRAQSFNMFSLNRQLNCLMGRQFLSRSSIRVGLRTTSTEASSHAPNVL